jgi:hypothetical protein
MATDQPTPTTKELEFEGYKFVVDTDLIDDVEALEIIDRIENKGQIAAVVPFLSFLIGKEGYEKMKAHFVEKDGKFRATKLAEVYKVIINNFDPKD